MQLQILQIIKAKTPLFLRGLPVPPRKTGPEEPVSKDRPEEPAGPPQKAGSFGPAGSSGPEKRRNFVPLLYEVPFLWRAAAVRSHEGTGLPPKEPAGGPAGSSGRSFETGLPRRNRKTA